jgi:large subunit ribosomal protein L17
MNRIFNRNKAHREHMLRNLATSLVLFEQIETTEAKAKEVKAHVDKILAGAKSNDFNTIRSLSKVFFDKNAVKKIVDELIPRYSTRNSGFIKSYHLKNRLGDNAPMMRLELIDKKTFVSESKEVKKSDKVESVDATNANTKVKVSKNGK